MDPTAALLREPASAGVFVDFDGTMSEIVDTPSEARPVEGAPETLTVLSRKFGVVAIVSGRRAAELVAWFGSEVELWGVHGAERALGGVVTTSEDVARFTDAAAAARRRAEAAVGESDLEGVLVEDKGVVVALHYRAARDRVRARARLSEIAQLLSRELGFRTTEGKMVIELRPPAAFSKQQVVLGTAHTRGLRAVAFVGDDKVDLPAFDALDQLAAEGVAAVRVAVSSLEAPPELLERADVVVEGPRGALEWLRSLL